jgi:microcystin-dependent protein
MHRTQRQHLLTHDSGGIMSEPFLAEIRIFGFNFAPRGWAACDAQILPINQNQSLFSLLGTVYGGDGRTTFALPGLRGRTPIHVSSSHAQGTKAGVETHSLIPDEMPSHTHGLQASDEAATQAGPTGNLLARPSLAIGSAYSTNAQAPDVSLAATAIANAGNGQGHNTMQPYLTLNFCIAIQGLFPSRN